MGHKDTCFSFITLTSTGFGDVTPIHPYARSLATFEAIVGQLDIAMLIARLIGLEIAWRRERRDAAPTPWRAVPRGPAIEGRKKPVVGQGAGPAPGLVLPGISGSEGRRPGPTETDAGTRLAIHLPSMASPVLLLLGVPESGTSALADALVRAGAALAGPPAGDPAGVSQHALAACGMRWDSLAPMPARLGKAPGLDAARAAIDVFLERMPSDAPLVVAEPLATRIVAMWRERAEAAERPFSTVLWLTHPGSAAAALARRRQFAPEKSLALWLAHLVEFEQATRGTARTVVTEETFLADPAAGFKRLAQATRFPPAAVAAKAPPAARQPTLAPPPLGLGSGLDAALDAGYRRLSSTVSGELKRSVDALALAARPAVQSAIPPWLAQEIEADRTRMQTLADMAAGHAARAERAARDLAAAPRDARALAAQVEGLRAEQVRERDTLTGQIEAMRAEQAGERSALTDQIEALRAEQARERDLLTAELASARGELARITASLAEVPQAEAALRTELGQAQRELSDERASIAKLADALEAARREADGHAHRFESARHHLERFAVEIEETRAALVAREDFCARLAAEADALHVREADHHNEVEALRREGETLRFERDEALHALERARRDGEERLAERESALALAADLRTGIEERERRIADLSAEADRMADAITDAAVRSAGLEEQLEIARAELASLQARHDELAARMRTLENRSLVRAAVWLGGGENPAEGRSTS